MNNRKKGIIILMIIAIFIVAVFVLGFIFIQNFQGKSIETDIEAPNFTLKNLNGEDVELSQLKGKVVLIDFWATYCKPCIIALPKIQEIHEKYSEDELVVLAINTGDKEDEIKSFIKENGYTFEILMADKDMPGDYGVRAIPFTILIDKQGNISYTRIGYRPGGGQALISEIDKLLGKD